MKKIKQRIAIPFIVIIILLPLITWVVFNIAMNLYILKTGKKELTSAMEATNYLIKQQIVSGAMNGAREEEVISSIPKLKSTLMASKLATNVEIVIFGKQGRLLYPRNVQADSIVDERLLNTLQNFDFGKKEIKLLRVDNRKVLVARNNSKQTAYKLIYILSLDSAREVNRSISLILIVIMTATALISIFIVMLISESISKPIKEICEAAYSIGRGKFINIVPNESSEEVNELGISINNMSNSLKEAENVQKTFLQNASHELRTPLMSIQGYAEGIMKGVFADNNAAAEIIVDETNRLKTLVEELLILSRIENKTYPLNLNRANLIDLMKDYIQRINGLALKSEKEIRYKTNYAEILVNIDEELLSQVVINIAANCLRHAKSTVEISTIKKSDFTQIIVRDDGDGIKKEDLPHIFDRFYKGKGGNTGLGLSIAKSAIVLLGGHISAGNWEKGAEFIIALPVYQI